MNDSTGKASNKTKDGRRLTLFTDPARVEQAKAARLKGQQNRKPQARRPGRLDSDKDIDNAINWVWQQVSQKRMSKDTAKQLMDLVKIRSDRLASSTLTALKEKVDAIEKARVANARS